MKKRRIRKIWALVNPIEHAINNACITDRAILDKLLLRELASLEAFAKGGAELQEWSDLANVNNITQTLASMKIGVEALPDCGKAELALIEAAERFQRTGRMGLSGPGIQAMRDVIEWNDLQRSSISRSKYGEAIRLTAVRIQNGHATINLNEKMKYLA